MKENKRENFNPRWNSEPLWRWTPIDWESTILPPNFKFKSTKSRSKL